MKNSEDKFHQAAQMIRDCERMVSLTGAGICTESGIPDYRGIGSAYWQKYNLDNLVFDRFIKDEDARKEYWRMDQEFYELVKKASPNAAHIALAELERMGKLTAIITQNVDGLHQKAGNSAGKVIEIHGNMFTVSCLYCHRKYPREEIYLRIRSGITVPYCNFCYGILKSDTVSFGQNMPQDLSALSLMATLKSDLFVVIGSSLLVQPAAYLVVKAKEAGAKIMMINLNSTPYDLYADLLIYDNAIHAMTRITDLVKTLDTSSR